MAKAVIFEQAGAPSVLKMVDVPTKQPAKGEVLLRQTAIEVNYIDVYHRTGAYVLHNNPKIPGVSAVGVIEAVGEEVYKFKVGERVGYATSFEGGGYASHRCISQELIFPIHEGIDDRIAAGCLVKGLTAHYLANRAYICRGGTAVLIHAAAGGVGQLLAQWAKNNGAFVLGTVGSDAKKAIALDYGCHVAINYNTENWVERVKQETGGWGVTAVYDSVGKATFDGSLEVLMNIGILVSYGQSSGPVPPFDIGRLSAKSLFITRPSLLHYKKNRIELVLSANELFLNLKDGSLKPPIYREFPLEQAAEAHALLESRTYAGTIVLIP